MLKYTYESGQYYLFWITVVYIIYKSLSSCVHCTADVALMQGRSLQPFMLSLLL